MKYIYKTKRVSKTKFKLDLSDGFEIKTKIKNFDVNSICLYDEAIASYYIEKNFLKKFKNILVSFTNVETDDDEDAVVRELDLLEYLVLNDYKNFLSLDTIKNMLKEIYTFKQNILSRESVFGKRR
ncbi:MAG: hypothetical protein R3Y13_01870 [bacterium]